MAMTCITPFVKSMLLKEVWKEYTIASHAMRRYWIRHADQILERNKEMADLDVDKRMPTIYDHVTVRVEVNEEDEILKSYSEEGWELVNVVPRSYHVVRSGSTAGIYAETYQLFFKKRRS